MTKENIYKSFLEDPILFEKNYLTPQQIDQMKFHEKTNIKLLEVIKIAINGNIDNESDGVTTRKINQYLNK